jgi:hypothetical protein
MPKTLLTDPKLKFSESPEDSSFNQVFDGRSLWEYLDMEENKPLRKMFDISMATNARLHSPEALAKGGLVYRCLPHSEPLGGRGGTDEWNDPNSRFCS